MFIAVGSGRRGLRSTAATSNAIPIPITLGPHCTKLPRNRARSAANSSAGKTPAMKKTKAYSRARMRRRPADWLSRSTGKPDEIPRAVRSRASGWIRVTFSWIPRVRFGDPPANLPAHGLNVLHRTNLDTAGACPGKLARYANGLGHVLRLDQIEATQDFLGLRVRTVYNVRTAFPNAHGLGGGRALEHL